MYEQAAQVLRATDLSDDDLDDREIEMFWALTEKIAEVVGERSESVEHALQELRAFQRARQEIKDEPEETDTIMREAEVQQRDLDAAFAEDVKHSGMSIDGQL